MLTHFNKDGRAKMVDVGDKDTTLRNAKAEAKIFMKSATLQLIKNGGHKKGDVLAVAQVAGIMAAKNTSSNIQMCHQINLRGVDISFELEINELPVISNSITFKNCDEDGVPDGFTDFNLDQANDIITYGATETSVTYFLSFSDANTGSNPINPSPYKNRNGNMVYARVENLNGCYRIGTVSLQVATTSFPAGYIQELQTCDEDDTNDGLYSFDLTQASTDFIAQFPTGQNLSVHYYRNLTDPQLEQNEIL
mgnify:CR=1 FL=1